MKILFMLVCIMLGIGAMLFVDARVFVRRYLTSVKDRNFAVRIVSIIGGIIFVSTLALLTLFKDAMLI